MELHHPHTLWPYTTMSITRKAQLSHGHRSPTLPRQSSTRPHKPVHRCPDRAPHVHTNQSTAAPWSWRQTTSEQVLWRHQNNVTCVRSRVDSVDIQCFGENGKNIGFYRSINRGVISVTVIKWHWLRLFMVQLLFNILIIVMNSTQTPTIGAQTPTISTQTPKINNTVLYEYKKTKLFPILTIKCMLCFIQLNLQTIDINNIYIFIRAGQRLKF